MPSIIPNPRDRLKSNRNGVGAMRPTAVFLIFTLAVLGGVAGIVAYLNRPAPSAISAEVSARLDQKIQEYARRLFNEPCNRTLELNLVTSLLERAEYAALIAFSQQTTQKCGPIEELVSSVFLAQMRSSDFVGAEQTAGQLATYYPADPQVYWWRAEVREKCGDFVGAYSDRLTTVSLVQNPLDLSASDYYDVARLAAKTGHPCDAVATLRDFIAFDPEKRRTQQLATLMRTWQQNGSCPPLSGTGTAFARFDPDATAIIVSVEVNGMPARMIVDTGASRTVLTKKFASRSGIASAALQGAMVSTANGETWVSGGRADSISLGGARLNSVPVFIQASESGSFGEGIDGLLGLSFLGNFYVQISSGSLELRPLD